MTVKYSITLQATPGAYDYQAYSDEEDYSEWHFITAANGMVVEAHEYGLVLAHRCCSCFLQAEAKQHQAKLMKIF